MFGSGEVSVGLCQVSLVGIGSIGIEGANNGI